MTTTTIVTIILMMFGGTNADTTNPPIDQATEIIIEDMDGM